MITGTVKAFGAPKAVGKATVYPTVVAELDGTEDWHDFYGTQPEKGTTITFESIKKNPKWNGNVASFTLAGGTDAPPVVTEATPVDVVMQGAGDLAAAKARATPSRDLSIVRQNSMRHVTAAAIEAGFFYKGMSRGEFQVALLSLVDDAEVITAYSTVNNDQLDALRTEYTK